MKSNKLAVVFPGIGYHKDKPLLYYSTRLAQNKGYEIVQLEYHDMPQKIRGDIAMMKKAAELAYVQSKEQLAGVHFDEYESVLFIGKSIGTVVLAKYASDHELDVKQIWYTPVEATFSFSTKDATAFIGDADPWSDVNEVKRLAREQGISLCSYPECNHSLECADVDRNIDIIKDVMEKTADYLA